MQWASSKPFDLKDPSWFVQYFISRNITRSFALLHHGSHHIINTMLRRNRCVFWVCPVVVARAEARRRRATARAPELALLVHEAMSHARLTIAGKENPIHHVQIFTRAESERPHLKIIRLLMSCVHRSISHQFYFIPSFSKQRRPENKSLLNRFLSNSHSGAIASTLGMLYFEGLHV
jgi:hypothetical protein